VKIVEKSENALADLREKYLYVLNLAAEYRLSIAQLKTINTLNGKYSYPPWVDIHHGKDFTGVFE